MRAWFFAGGGGPEERSGFMRPGFVCVDAVGISTGTRTDRWGNEGLIGDEC